MDPRHRNCERKRQRRLISTEWCQIDLFLLCSSMNMPYISIKINYPQLRIQGNPSLPGEHANGPEAGTTSSPCLISAAAQSIFFSPPLWPLKHTSAPRKNKHTYTHSAHNHHHNRYSIPFAISVVIITPGKVFPHQLPFLSYIIHKIHVAACLLLLQTSLSIRWPYLQPSQSIFHRLAVRADFMTSHETLQ